MNDLISRKAAIDEMKSMYHAVEKWRKEANNDVIKARAESCMAILVETKLRVEGLPLVQPEEAIPISWFEERIEMCRMVGDRTFSSVAVIMHVMLNEWRREQHE